MGGSPDPRRMSTSKIGFRRDGAGNWAEVYGFRRLGVHTLGGSLRYTFGPAAAGTGMPACEPRRHSK